jgi:hypothetical protein
MEPDVPIVMAGVGPSAGGGRPTLKDYLDMMKANKMPIPGKAGEGKNNNFLTFTQNLAEPETQPNLSDGFSILFL